MRAERRRRSRDRRAARAAPTTPPAKRRRAAAGAAGTSAERPRMGLDAYVDCACAEEGTCTHPRGKAADERIASWGGVRAFQEAMRTLDAAQFSALLLEIPDANAGETEASAA